MRIVRIQQGEKDYAVDLDDLDGNEAGTLGRFQERMGANFGAVYAVLLIAKQRAGEKATEESVMKYKLGELKDRTNEVEDDDAGPPVSAGDEPAAD